MNPNTCFFNAFHVQEGTAGVAAPFEEVPSAEPSLFGGDASTSDNKDKGLQFHQGYHFDDKRSKMETR